MTSGGDVRYARSGDVDVAYTVLGDGPIDIVFVPGFVSHLDLMWEIPPISAIVRNLADHARVLTFDKRGTGLSDRTFGSGSLDDRADDIRAVMDAAGMERAAFFAVSEGGPLSILFAAMHPGRVTHLALYGTLARGRWAPDYLVGTPAEDDERFLAAVEAAWGTGEALSFFIQHVPRSAEVRRTLARFERSACTPGMAVAALRLSMDLDIRTLLPTVDVPTLVLHNRRDPLVPVGHAEYLAEHIPGAQLVTGDGDSHVSWRAGDSTWVRDALASFLVGSAPGVSSPGSTAAGATATRGLATVLFTDIVGSTDVASRLGDRAWRAVLDGHDRASATAITRCAGRLVKATGDGAMATFDSPSRAIECARTVAETVAELGIEVRAGVHTGEVEHRGDDIGGIGVHLAARIASEAGPSQLWVSRTVRDLVIGSDVVLESRGTRALKGVPDEWELFEVVG